MKEKIIKAADFVIYWALVLLPFSVAISPVPANLFCGLAIFCFLVKKILSKKIPYTVTAINIPVILFFAMTLLSLVNSVSLADSMKGGVLRLLQFVFLLWVVAGEIKDKRHIQRIVFSASAGLILVSFDGIWQVATGNDFIRGYAPIVNLGLVRATASFKDSNLLGIYLSALAPLVFGLALYYYRGKQRLGFIVAGIIALAGILLTYSRPTILAVYLVFLFWAIARRNKLFISGLIILALLGPLLLPASIKQWAKEVEYNPVRFMCNDDRIAVYRNSINMIKDHPVIGLGANTYMKNYKKYKESPEYRDVVTSDYMYAHNIFLHLAAEVGLLGLALFFWLLYWLFKEIRSVYYRLKDNYVKIAMLSLAGCLIAFLVNGLTESSLYYARVAILFWYLAGLSLGVKNAEYAV